jgi:hypothetical protein
MNICWMSSGGRVCIEAVDWFVVQVIGSSPVVLVASSRMSCCVESARTAWMLEDVVDIAKLELQRERETKRPSIAPAVLSNSFRLSESILEDDIQVEVFAAWSEEIAVGGY